MTNLSFYPEDDDPDQKKADPTDDPANEDPEEGAEETELSPDVEDEDDLLDDGIAEGEEIE